MARRTLGSDNFNRANETPVSGGGAWSALGGGVTTMDLVSNAIQTHDFSSDAAMLHTASACPADQWVQCDLTCGTTGGGGLGHGLTGRGSTGARTCYRVVGNHGTIPNFELGKFISGAFTSLATWSTTFTDGDTFSMEMIGT